MVGTILKNIGCNVKIIDGAIDPNYQKHTLSLLGSYDMVGFSVMTSQVPMAYELSASIKKWP